MKTILPFYTSTLGSLEMNRHSSLIEAYWEEASQWFPNADERLIIVCDKTCWRKSMEALGAKVHFLKAKIPYTVSGCLPIDTIALDELLRLRLVERDEPIMIIDNCGRGLLPAMRREARRRYEEMQHFLVSVQFPKDHPAQVQTFYFVEPLGFGFFPVRFPINNDFVIVRVDGGPENGEAFIRPNNGNQWELFLPNSYHSSSERLLLFALCGSETFIPLQNVKPDDLTLSEDNRLFRAVAFSPPEGMQALLAFHVALQEEGTGVSCCSAPVIFDESLWTYGSPGHLYAVTPCKNASSGKVISGRQELPPLFAADGEMAVGCPEDMFRIEELVTSGRCCGFHWTGKLPTSPALIRLLRSAPAKKQAAVKPTTGMTKRIFPEHSNIAYINYLEQLNAALTNTTHGNGEAAVLVKGLLDFLSGVSRLLEKPQFLRKAIS